MNCHRGPTGPGRRVLFTPAILDGLPWVGRTIRNACLRRHCHQLGRAFRSKEEGLQPLRQACRRLFHALEARSRVLTDLHPTEFPVVSAVLRMAAYQAHWLREPEDWQPAKEEEPRQQWASLLKHLFQFYAVPASLDAVWLLRGPLEHLERDLYCAMGAGRSVRTVQRFPKSVSHRVLHLALQECEEATWTQAVWRAQLKVLGADGNLAKQVMESRVVSELPHHARWHKLVAKFAGGRVEAGEFGLMADALAMVDEQDGSPRCDQLLRLPLQELRQFCRRWWRGMLQSNHEVFSANDLLRPSAREALRLMATVVWKPMLPDCWKVVQFVGEGLIQEWRIVELCSQAALIEEGRAMHHCAAHYAGRCREGRRRSSACAGGI